MRQKIGIIVGLSLFIFTPFYGQNRNDLNEMISNSIQNVVEIHQRFAQKGILQQVDSSKHYILKDNLPLNFAASSYIEELNQKIVSSNEIPLKELKKGIFCYSFSYFVLDNDVIKVHITTKKLKVKKKSLESSLLDSFIFTYRYFCDEQEWRLIDNKPKIQ